MNDNKKESGNKGKTGVVLLLLVLVICAIGTAGIYVWKNGNSGKVTKPASTDKVEDTNKDRTVSDEAELRKLLEEDSDYNITVAKDITVDDSFVVNGNKTLSGTGKIVMALNAKAYQHLMHVQKGATLIVDGVTLDGNAIAGGVKVDKGGELTYLSGEILYGFPYGIETDGKVTMKGGTIDEAIHTGIYVTSSGETYMESGAILNSGAASVKLAENAYMKISGDSRLQGSGSSILNISGKCDVTGGVMSDCNSYLAGVTGELNVEYQGEEKDGMLEWYNCGRSVILAGESSVVNVKGLYIHDVKTYAVCNAEGNAKISLENCLFEKIEKSAVVLKKGTITMKNIRMKDVKQHGLQVNQDADVTVENMTVTSPGQRGIYNLGGTVVAKNLEITSPKQYAIGNSYIKDAETNAVRKGEMTIEGLTITGAQGECAINVDGSDLTLKNAKITDTKSHGIRLKNASNATLNNVDISATGAQGIRIDTASKLKSVNVKIANTNSYGVTVLEGSELVSSNMEINASGNSGVYVRMSKADLNGLTVNEPHGRGIYSHGGTVTGKNVVITSPTEYGIGDSYYKDQTIEKTQGNVTVDGLTLTGVKGDCAVNVDGSVLTLKNAVITDSDKNGICTKNESEAQLVNVSIDKTGAQGIRVDTGSKIKTTNVKISNAKTYGVTVLEGGSLESKKMEITDSGNSGVYVRLAEADLKELTVTKPGARGIYNHGGTVEAKDVVITSPKEYGIGNSYYQDKTVDKTQGNVTVDGLTLTGVKGECAINVDDSVLTLKNAVITDSDKNAICVKKESEAKLVNVSIDQAGAQGIRIDTKAKVKSTNVKVTNTKSYGVTVLEGSSLKSDKMEIMDTGNSGMYVRLSEADCDELKIVGTGAHGIYNHGGTVDAKNVEIESTKEYGIENVYYKHSDTEKTEGSMDIDGLKMSGVKGANGIHLDTAALTLENAEVTNKNGNGICVQKNSEAKLTKVSVNDTKGQGIRIDNGAKVTGSEVKVTNTTSYGITVLTNAELNSSDVEIGNTGNFGLYVRASKADVKNLTVTEAKGKYAVQIEDSEVTLNGVLMEKLKDRAVYVTGNGKATLLNAQLYDSALEENKSVKEMVLNFFAVPVVQAAEDNTDTGFIQIDKGSVLTIKEQSVITGQKEKRTHGIWVAGTLNLEKSKITGFQSDLDGAGCYVKETGTVNITDGEFLKNKTELNGGALYVKENAAVTITGGNYEENQAKLGGGAIFSNANITINGGTFKKNKTLESDSKGGVVYLEKNKLTINGGTFVNNSAEWGGVVYTKGTTEVTGGVFDGNLATAVGGSALMSNRGNIKILGTTDNKIIFKNNYVSEAAHQNADGGGGAILLINEATLTLQNCEFTNNLHVGDEPGNGTEGCDITFVRNPASGKKHELVLNDQSFEGIVRITKAHSAGRFVVKSDNTDWNLGRTAEGFYTLSYDTKELIEKK